MISAPGVISVSEIYTLPEARRCLRLGRHSFRRLREHGLPVLRIGRCCFVEGSALCEALRATAAAEASQKGPD